MQEELSSYADDVFETPSEADFKQLDESVLTGSALDKSKLERSHLMLWVNNLIKTNNIKLQCIGKVYTLMLNSSIF